MTPRDRTLDLRIDGAAPPAALAGAACGAFVRQVLNAPALAEVSFADPDLAQAGALRIGATLSLALRSGAELFDGEITAVEHEVDGAGGRILRVRAYDRLHRLRKRQRTRAITDVALGDLVEEAAAFVGVGASTPGGAPRRPLVIQHDQSDLELLVELAGDCGKYVFISHGVLQACTLAGVGEEALPLRLGRELLSGRAVASAESLRRSTATRAWDTSRVATLEGAASLASQDAEEIRDSGLAAFEGLGERTLVDRLSADAAEAEALAQADLDRAAAGQVVLEAVANGDPRLRPGRLVALEGLGEAVDGRICVTRATHLFDEVCGYVVELGSEVPPRTVRERGTAATLARVTDADDPDGLSRVRASLPTYGDVQTGWMPVVIMGAGASKGIAVLPEPGDDVLVLFPDGDPSRGLVLGGLYGERASPGPRRGSGARGFTVRTPGGQCLTLASGQALARLETSAGDIFELGPEGTRLTATQDLLIEAPGRRLIIRADAVEFERG